jgi:hypothetical protein
MATIKARVGSQNAIRVLSNASTPPTRLINLSDVNQTFSNQDGLILVWDLPTQSFIMTSVIDSSSTTIQGIAYFENTTESTLPTNGALIVSGGVGVGKNLNVGGDLSVTGITTLFSNVTVNAPFAVNDTINVTGIATFGSDLDINAAVDILNGLVVSGPVTLASSGGITTTGGDFYVATNATVGGNLKVDGTSEFIGNATFRGGTIGIGDADTDDINVSGEFVSNLVPNDDDTYDLGLPNKRWRNGQFSGLVTSTNLSVSGLSSFTSDVEILGDVRVTGFVSVTEGLYYDPGDYDGPNGVAYFDSTGKLVSGISTQSAISTSNYILTTEAGTDIPVWTSTIDGGIY